MILAAILADAVCETLCPLSEGLLPMDGPLMLTTPEVHRRGKALLVGVGGIGVYAATLAAALGYTVCLLDFDHVEESNLNRQGLFTRDQARCRTYKAVAARDALLRLFPKSVVTAEVCRAGAGFGKTVAVVDPSVLLSAVDNAPTRLLLQSVAREMSIPLIQGGTDIFAADCYTQECTGPLLDQQMHGALSDAASRASMERSLPGGCAVDPSYVVPGMMAYRMVQAMELYRGLLPVRWRVGGLPVEQRRRCDVFEFDQLSV
jgi:ThiF family